MKTQLIKSLVMLFVLLGVFQTRAQTFFPKTQIYYHLNVSYFGGPVPEYRKSIDTLTLDSVVGPKEYYHISSKISQENRFIANGKKVYFQAKPDTWEILYDFTLKAGDTMPLIGGSGLGDSIRVVIDSVGIINFRGKDHILQIAHQISGCGKYNGYVFVENIGSLDAGLYFWYKACFEVGTITKGICDTLGGISWRLYQSGWADIQLNDSVSCAEISNSLGTSLLKKSIGIRLFPNPASDQLQIKFAMDGLPTNLTVINVQGEVVKIIRPVSSSMTVNISDLPPGIYTIQAITGKQTILRRFVIAD